MTTSENTFCLNKALFYTHQNKKEDFPIKEGEFVTYPPDAVEAKKETPTKLYVEQKMSSTSVTSYEPRILYSIYYPYETVPTIRLKVSNTQPFEIQTLDDTLNKKGLHNIIFINNTETSKLTSKTAEDELSNSKGVVLTFIRRLTVQEKRTNAEPDVILPKNNEDNVLEFLKQYNETPQQITKRLSTMPALSLKPIARGPIQGSQPPKSSPKSSPTSSTTSSPTSSTTSSPRPEGQTPIPGTPKPKGGKKSRTRKQKTRKQKSRKQKSRKQKTRKQKTRKQKTRKQKTRKH
jgi:hypothetical protein